MVMIYSNKVTTEIVGSTTTTLYPIKSVSFYVSTDGKTWGTSASGNTIYFKAECYDSNGNLADTTISGIGNCGTGIATIPFSTKIIIGTQTSPGTINTKDGIAEWANTAPKTASITTTFGAGGCDIYALPYPHPINQTQINDNIYNPIISNNVSTTYLPLTTRSPSYINITVSPMPDVRNIVVNGKSFKMYDYAINTTYTWTFQVLDANNNPVPICTVQGLLLEYLSTGSLTGNLAEYQYTTDQNGEFSINWAPTTGAFPEMALYLDIPNYKALTVYYLGMKVQYPISEYGESLTNVGSLDSIIVN